MRAASPNAPPSTRPCKATAADLIKLAMIRIHRERRERAMGARLILQVHDELVLEVPEAEVAPTVALVREAMEQVHPLHVPLVADLMVGPNWRDMEDGRCVREQPTLRRALARRLELDSIGADW